MMLAMLIILFFLFMVLGMPIAFTMGASAAFTFMYAGIDPMVMAQRTFTSTNSFALMAIPLFGRQPHGARRHNGGAYRLLR